MTGKFIGPKSFAAIGSLVVIAVQLAKSGVTLDDRLPRQPIAGYLVALARITPRRQQRASYRSVTAIMPEYSTRNARAVG